MKTTDYLKYMARNTWPNTTAAPAERGEGIYFWDVNGKRYVDFSSQTLNLLLGQCHPKVVAAITEQASRLTFETIERELQASDAVMYAVGLGRGARVADLRARLARLSDTSGGRAVFAEDTTALARAFGDVVADLSHQYVLSFVPARSERDGTWHDVLPGDLAKKTDTGGMFLVPLEGAEADEARARAKAGELVPTGPMFGKKMRWPEGRPAEIER